MVLVERGLLEVGFALRVIPAFAVRRAFDVN
eukprot:COSAG02_NODE_35214_length_472_cov_0.546917_1_plen_30_part_10